VSAAPLLWSADELALDTVPAVRAAAYRSGRVLEREGLAIYAFGTARELTMPLGLDDSDAVRGVETALAELAPLATNTFPDADTVPDAQPLAIGALSFDPREASALVIPEFAVLSRAGRAVVIHVGTEETLSDSSRPLPWADDVSGDAVDRANEAPDDFTLGSTLPHEDFRLRVAQAVEAIGRGELDKVVLVREVDVTANRPLRQHHLLERLRALHPSCCVFGIDGFVGASPELLVRRTGADVVSQPLAGTVARSGDPDEDRNLAEALLASAKDRSEHKIVVEAIVGALAPMSTSVEAPNVPHVLNLRNVTHLATRITAQLAPRASGNSASGNSASSNSASTSSDAVHPSVLALVAALHPTPAVGGWPKEDALDYLRKHEAVERGRFAGPVGWMSAGGDGEWWLGIRSALLDGTTARLFAGVGIVEGSDPAAELAETQLKLQALLAAAVRP